MEAVDRALDDLYSAVKDGETTVFVHFGVSGIASGVNLERQAYNEATFRVPDEAGQAPQGATIVPSGPASLRTTFGDALRTHVGHASVQWSDDPGRFVCNYIYFSSLSRASAVRARGGDAHALFVHVPPHSRMPEPALREFARGLLSVVADPSVLSACLALPPPPPAAEATSTDASPEPAHGADDVAALVAMLQGAEAAEAQAARAQRYKMALLVRTDLGMGRGKVAAQCCHAALGVYRRSVRAGETAYIDGWETTGEAKIVLKVPSEEEMLSLVSTARAIGLPAYVVRDAGRTQVAAGTATVAAIGPAPVEEVDAITGALSLL